LEPEEYEVLASVEEGLWWHAGMRRICAAFLHGYRSDDAGEVLDAGCGTGGNADLLSEFGRVWGLDISPLAVCRARRRFPGRTIQGSVEDLPFASSAFGLVASLEVLYHRQISGEPRALREAARVLHPGGRLLLRLPAYPSLLRRHDRRVHTRRRYRLPEVRRLLESAGFRVCRASYVNTLLLPAALLSVLLERLGLSRGEGSQLNVPGRFVNGLFRAALGVEARLLAQGVRFPAGLSILCLAEKP
jgi:SAM-dependent methyltransferase